MERTWENKVLQRLNTNSAGAGVDEEDVGRFEGGLARSSPEPQLAIVFPLFLGGALEDRGGLDHDVGHGSVRYVGIPE